MQDQRKERFRVVGLALCVTSFGALLAGCQSAVVGTSTPSPFAAESVLTARPLPEVSRATTEPTTMRPVTPTILSPTSVSNTLLPEIDEATAEPSMMAQITPTEPSPTPASDTLPSDSDDARQLTAKRAGTPWWSEDGRTLYFSTIGPDSQRWAIDLATDSIRPVPDVLSPYRRAVSLTASLIPTDVSLHDIGVSPSGSKIILPRHITPTESVEEACDGESCVPIPANEMWLIDVESQQLTQLQMGDELIAMVLDFRWSNIENRALIRVPSPSTFWTTGSDTPTVWIADFASGRVYPKTPRDNRVTPWSISPSGSLVIYELRESGPSSRSCDMYLWAVDSQQEDRLLPDLPCAAHFWLSDDRTVIFVEEEKQRTVFWAYDVAKLEQREVASPTALPDECCCWYVLAPDEHSVAAVPYCFDGPSGIWLVTFDLSADDQ